LVFLAGMAARGAVGDRDAREPQAEAAPASNATASIGPSREVGGAPVGFARSRDGVQAAAIAYTATLSQRLLYLDPASAKGTVRAIAADASVDTISRDVLAGLQAVREPLTTGTGATWWVVEPLAAKVEAYTADRARVSVWIVRVLSRQGVVVPQSSWVTETVELVWEGGDWRLWSDESAPGPTPVLDGSDLPASAAELDAELTGFELLDLAVAAS
ncbi:MAG: hypothetical protein ACRD0G_12785, partial [Acidimicrobiales bacterium]